MLHRSVLSKPSPLKKEKRNVPPPPRATRSLSMPVTARTLENSIFFSPLPYLIDFSPQYRPPAVFLFLQIDLNGQPLFTRFFPAAYFSRPTLGEIVAASIRYTTPPLSHAVWVGSLCATKARSGHFTRGLTFLSAGFYCNNHSCFESPS